METRDDVMLKKVKLVYIPFLVITLLFTVLYSVLAWLLQSKLQLLSFKNELLTFGLPAALGFLVIILFLRPRLKLLYMENKKGSYRALYYMVALIPIFGGAATGYTLIGSLTAKLNPLRSISELEQTPQERYYTLDSFYLDKQNVGFNATFEVTGKHSQNFDMDIFLTVPILLNKDDTTEVKAWLGLTRGKQISNSLSQDAKESEYANFARAYLQYFDSTDYSDFTYLERVPVSNNADAFAAAIKSTKLYNARYNTVLTPEYEPFAYRNDTAIMWMKISMIGGMLLFLFIILLPRIDEHAYENFLNGKPEGNRDLIEDLSFLIPVEGYTVTPFVVFICAMLYIGLVFAGAGILSFDILALRKWGANYGPLVYQGQWWRLLTSTVLHGGIMHILNNMIGLILIGLFLEPRIRSLKYLIMFILTGVSASALSLWWHPNVTSVGASGAIFGLMGLLFALSFTFKVSNAEKKTIWIAGGIYAGFNLLLGLLLPGTDNAAHIGGLISGFILGFYIAYTLPDVEEVDEVQEETIE